MEGQIPNLQVIEGGLSQQPVSPAEIPQVVEKQGFLPKIRRALSKIAQKLDTNPQNIPPPGKAF